MSKSRGPYSSPLQQARKQRILHAARLQLERHGLAALTMQSIAESSETSLKTLYNLYGSRDLLLLAAASGLLDDLEGSVEVQNSEPGIPRLLAFTQGVMRGFEYTPEYARVIVSILLRAEKDHPSANTQLGRIQQFAHEALCTAHEQGELQKGLDLEELSYLICANQWGIALLWEKGLIRLEQLELQTNLSHYLTLTPLCRGKRKQMMNATLQELLSGSPVQKIHGVR
ncbi:MAG: TetR/AcrR family transcriptional regulator [Halioglobus sp.]